MSRDFRPFESFLADKMHFERTGKHFYELELKWTYPDSDEEHIDTKQLKLQEYAKDYKYLVITNPDGIFVMITSLQPETIKECEKQVKRLCVCIKNNEDLAKADADELVVNWFLGKLDKNFYYREDNDALLCKGLLKKEKEIIFEKTNKNNLENKKEKENKGI